MTEMNEMWEEKKVRTNALSLWFILWIKFLSALFLVFPFVTHCPNGIRCYYFHSSQRLFIYAFVYKICIAAEIHTQTITAFTFQGSSYVYVFALLIKMYVTVCYLWRKMFVFLSTTLSLISRALWWPYWWFITLNLFISYLFLIISFEKTKIYTIISVCIQTKVNYLGSILEMLSCCTSNIKMSVS